MLGVQAAGETEAPSTKTVEAPPMVDREEADAAPLLKETGSENGHGDATEPVEQEEPEEPRRDKGKRKLTDEEVDADASRKRRDVGESAEEGAEELGVGLEEEDEEEEAVETSEGEDDSEDGSEEDSDEDDEEEDDEEGPSNAGKKGSSSAMAEDLDEELTEEQELQELLEDYDDIPASEILTTGRRTRGKQIDFVAAMERDRLERGAGSSSATAPAEAGLELESEDDGFDEDFEDGSE
ncbi:hypothetical protein DFJ74DRAFT_691594 [Hyaloraphidium curvatum]|nr:hypothetical protein DFJ74DRAFT_691594 [Hyaloraphidium curvatum]